MKTVKEQFRELDSYISLHLKECCLEIREWENTGILPDGRVKFAKTLLTDPSLHPHVLTHLDHAIKRAAMEYVIAFRG